MKPLPPAPQANAILSFDFDGTIHHPASDPPVPRALFECLQLLRERHGHHWGINTGRSLEHLIEGIRESGFPFLPDWVVVREREIFHSTPHGLWQAHKPWNRRCETEVHKLFKRARKLLRHIRHEIEEHTGAEWMQWAGEPAGVVARSEEEMAWIVERVAPIAAEEPQLAWQRNSIWLRFGHRDFQKGSSLAEVARLHSVPVARCFAMGDSHNDFEMLDPAHAAMTACPANSVEAIKAHVAGHGGLITRAAHGEGAIEALEHYFGSVR